MANTNKILVALIMLSLLTTVIGSWLIFEKLNDAQITCTTCQNQAPVIKENTASAMASLTIAPSGHRNVASARLIINIDNNS